MTEERIEKLLRETEFENNEHKETLKAKLHRKGQEMKNNISKLQEIFADAQLVREMAAVETPEDARKWFGDHGVELSLYEVKELGMALTGTDADRVELELDELEDVAGGKLGPVIDTPAYLSELAQRVISDRIIVPGSVGSVRDEGEETMRLSDSIKWSRVR